MGSLPNLHELSSGCVDVIEKNDFHSKNIQGKESTVDWRRTNHRPLYHTRSLGSNPNSCVVNAFLLKRLSYDVKYNALFWFSLLIRYYHIVRKNEFNFLF